MADQAAALGFSTLVTDTIEETGNVAFFAHLGFKVTERDVASEFESDTHEVLHVVKLERKHTTKVLNASAGRQSNLVLVRIATRADVPQMVRIFHDTIHTVNTRDYTPEQVRAWSPTVPDAEAWAEKKLGTRATFVAEVDGVIAGFGELENNGHIDCFYCHHQFQRRGVGKAIFLQIENQARALGIERLFVEASITARSFFEAHGFRVVKQQTVVCRGVAMINFAMEKIVF